MEIAILGILILLNGFLLCLKLHLVSSKTARLEQARLEGSKGAKQLCIYSKIQKNFLSAIQVGITLISIVTGVYGGINIADSGFSFLRKFAITQPYAHEIALTLTILLITYISIVVGELVPKQLL